MFSRDTPQEELNPRSKRPQVRVLPGVPRKACNYAENGHYHQWPFVVSEQMCTKCVP